MKRTIWTKITTLLLLLVFALVACGQPAETKVTTAGAKPTEAAAPKTEADSETEKGVETTADDVPETSGTVESSLPDDLIEIDFMNMNQSWNPVVFGDDPVTTRFMEKTGVKLICSAPSGDGETIANTMLFANEYPSMMTMPNMATYNKYVSAGALYSIDELVEQYDMPQILDGTHIPLNSLKAHRSEDGKLYGFPNWFSEDGFGSVGQSLSVRNDIYAKFGSPKLETMEDYYDFLVQIKDEKLEHDGIPVWPMCLDMGDSNMIGNFANIWGANIQSFRYFNEETNRIEYMLRAPQLVSALSFLNRVYHDGLLDPEVFTNDSTQRNEAYSQGKYATIFTWYWNLWTANSALSQVDEDVYYTCIDIPEGTPGTTPFFGYHHTAGDMGVTITKNCQETEGAMRFAEYFLSPEGNILDWYGVEGVTMEFVDGEPRLMEGVYEAKLADWEAYGRRTGLRVFDFWMNQKYNWERYVESPERMANRAMAAKYSFDATFLKPIQVESTTEEGILNAEITTNLIPELTKIILQEDNGAIEHLVQDLLKSFEEKGLTALEDECTRQYLRIAS